MAAAAAAEDRPAAPIEVIDVLGGFARLVARSPTLGGSIPLRAAQACTPLLEGNAVGREIVLEPKIALVRGLRGFRVEAFERRELFEGRVRGVLPTLVPRGLASPAIVRRFASGPLVVRGRRAELFTGLVARVPPGVRLRVSSTANRRPRTYLVEESFVVEHEGPTPIVLSLSLEDVSSVVLQGEVATVIPLVASFRAAYEPLASGHDAARAHVRFYDRGYFESKKRGATRKYRALARRPPPASAADHVRVVEAGPRQVEISPGRLVVRSGVPLTFAFDGSEVSVDIAKAPLAAVEAEIRAAWAPVLAGALADEETFQGALLYLTKYVTPHPRGEPHFFVKPPALVVTPPGWSTVVEGRRSPGFDVMRGVVRTDVFHAVPAVFAIASIGERFRVEAGEPIAELFPSPRSVLETPFAVRATDALGGAEEASHG